MATRKKHIFILLGAVLATTALGGAQLREILKVGGVAAVVSAFGKEINKGINKLQNHEDSKKIATKVVPILSIGINRSSAIGAAQVMGPPELVKKVTAVAQPEAEILGKEVRLRALIPVSSKDVLKDIRRVDGVGVSGIVDLKL